MCGAAALGGEVVEGAEEEAQACAAYGDEAEAGFDGGPDCYVAVGLVSWSLCGEERGGVRCCEQEVISDRYDFDVWDADHRCYSGTVSF